MAARPYRIALVNMPFARLSMPSLALTQLSAVLKRRFETDVEVSIHYLNLDFTAFLEDVALYNHMHSATAFMTGIGEWFFRQAAFPEVADNADAYYDRYYDMQDDASRAMWHRLDAKRTGISTFFDRLIDQYGLLDVDLVGFSAFFSQTVASIAMARRIKLRNSAVMAVIGGACCDASMGMELAKHVSHFDAVFSGPALKSFPAFVGHLLNGDRDACDSINGVLTQTNHECWPDRNEAGGIEICGDDADINQSVSLEYAPFLDAYEAAFPEGGGEPPALLFETSRGCWWAQKHACRFCGLDGLRMQHRVMTPENAIAHIESLYRYVLRCRIFMGVDTSLPKGYTRDVMPHLSPPPEMVLFYELRPDVTRDEVQILVDANVRAFQPGIESLSTASLKLMRKGISAFQNIMFLKHCSAHPLRLDWNLLVFSPGEEEAVCEKALQDIPHLTHLAPPSGAYPIGFVRFSDYFEHADAYGLDLKPKDFYGLTYPFGAQSVQHLAYHFDDVHRDTELINAWLGRLNAAIAQWTQRWLGGDGCPKAQLCFVSDDVGWAVYDSREQDAVWTEINATEKRLLDALDRPRSLGKLDAEWGANLATLLARFRARGWLFEEDDRMLSLVT